jgi:hypothetical protein
MRIMMLWVLICLPPSKIFFEKLFFSKIEIFQKNAKNGKNDQSLKNGVF